jgi:hypothetical protein
MKYLIFSVIAAMTLAGCDTGSATPASTGPTTMGGYTFVLVGELHDGTGYSRPVWEVTAPDGTKYVAIRGYGVSSDRTGGKTPRELD